MMPGGLASAFRPGERPTVAPRVSSTRAGPRIAAACRPAFIRPLAAGAPFLLARCRCNVLPGWLRRGSRWRAAAGERGLEHAPDHIAVLDLALEQLDQQALDSEILVRADGAGATHELTV